MFSTEFNGYKKKEVDEYISQMKADHERALMEEKLKVLESEKKLLDYKNKSVEIERREKNIMTALESFKRFQAEGSRNIEVLRGEQLRVVYVQMQNLFEQLNNQFPGLLLNSSYKKLIEDVENILSKIEAKKEEIVNTGTENDPMRILLNKMKEKKVSQPREIKIERNDFKDFRNDINSIEHAPSQIKPVCDLQLKEGDEYDNLVDKFLNTQPAEEQPKSLKIQSNGFDLKEAVNPKDDLSEIMKAFDFYTDDENK